MLEYLCHYQAPIYADLYNELENILFQDDNNMGVIRKHIILSLNYIRRD